MEATLLTICGKLVNSLWFIQTIELKIKWIRHWPPIYGALGERVYPVQDMGPVGGHSWKSHYGVLKKREKGWEEGREQPLWEQLELARSLKYLCCSCCCPAGAAAATTYAAVVTKILIHHPWHPCGTAKW